MNTLIDTFGRRIDYVRLSVTVEHLTPPERLKEGNHFFVAWQRKNADTKWSRIATMNCSPARRCNCPLTRPTPKARGIFTSCAIRAATS